MQKHFLKTVVLGGAFLAATVAQATGFTLVLSESKFNQPVQVSALGPGGLTTREMELGDTLPIAPKTMYFFNFQEELDAECPVLEAGFELRCSDARVSRFHYRCEAGSGEVIKDLEHPEGYSGFLLRAALAGTALNWLPGNCGLDLAGCPAMPGPAVPPPAEERKEPAPRP